MGLTRLSIQRPVFVIVLIAVFLVLGLRSRSGMLVDMNPKVDIPYVTVTTVYPGTGPEEIETLVTKPIEDAVSSTDQIKHIRSSSQFGLSLVNLEFELDADVDVATEEVRQKVEGALRTLPKERLFSATSESLNWVALGGVFEKEPQNFELLDYVPVYRTPANTGGGWAFGRWQ